MRTKQIIKNFAIEFLGLSFGEVACTAVNTDTYIVTYVYEDNESGIDEDFIKTIRYYISLTQDTCIITEDEGNGEVINVPVTYAMYKHLINKGIYFEE